jgi:hypothetical protein
MTDKATVSGHSDKPITLDAKNIGERHNERNSHERDAN